PPRSTLLPYTTLFRSEVAPPFTTADDGTVIRSKVVRGRAGLDSDSRLRPRTLDVQNVGVGDPPGEVVYLGRLTEPLRTLVGPDRSEEHTSELQSRFDL